MKQTKLSKILSFVLCLALVTAIAFICIGCNDNKTTQEPSSETPSSSDNAVTEDNVLGQGETSFTLCITFADKSEKTYTVNTDKTVVGDALLELGVISGTEGPYGLMVETVDGTTVKYEEDGKYWAFYIDGEYAMTGVDSTDIVAGSTYTFKVE